MPQKLNMQRPSSLHSMQLIALLILSCSYIINHAFAFTSCSPPAIASRNIATVNSRIQQPPSTKLHYSTNNNNNNNDNNTSKKTRQQQKVQVAGVSVSPLGFLVILQSIMNDGTNNDQKRKMLEVAFPILLTSSGISTSNNGDNGDNNNNLTIPTLFQENIDQTSVTTPEALTFLQLLNGVDMATPILPPDTLSNVCVWYAFLLEEQLLVEGDDVEGEGIGDGGLLYEDELGLETSSLQSSTQPSNTESNEQKEQEEEYHDKYSSALNYIRGMVRTTLPPSKDGSYFVNYIDASEWQRARVQLPRVWLYGVRMEMMDLTLFQNNDDEDDGGTLSSSSAAAVGVVGRVPVKYTLQCSVDDGLKRLEIPLFAIPSSYQLKESTSTSSSSRLKRQLDISNEILQELSHNYTPETSASFLSLALYHRYNKSNQQGSSSSSNANNNDGPTLKVDEDLLNQLVQMQQQKQLKSKQYCWPTSIRSIIQANGLPMYRPLYQIQEEDQRVLERIYGGNDDDLDNGGGSGGMEDDASLSSSDTSKKEPKKKALTLEQQALQQRLKSAWKIAMQRGDEGALEKIQKAMEDLEKELIIVEEEDTSTLDRIQRAMRERDEVLDGGGDEEEEVVGLVSDLEEAIRMEGSLSDGDDREEEL